MNTEDLNTLLDKMEDAGFVQQFVADPNTALEAAGLAFTVAGLTDALAKEPVEFERFLEALSTKVDIKTLTNAASSCCASPA